MKCETPAFASLLVARAGADPEPERHRADARDALRDQPLAGVELGENVLLHRPIVAASPAARGSTPPARSSIIGRRRPIHSAGARRGGSDAPGKGAHGGNRPFPPCQPKRTFVKYQAAEVAHDDEHREHVARWAAPAGDCGCARQQLTTIDAEHERATIECSTRVSVVRRGSKMQWYATGSTHRIASRPDQRSIGETTLGESRITCWSFPKIRAPVETWTIASTTAAEANHAFAAIVDENTDVTMSV